MRYFSDEDIERIEKYVDSNFGKTQHRVDVYKLIGESGPEAQLSMKDLLKFSAKIANENTCP